MAFIYDLTDTWNAGGTTFSAIKMNVTDTASAAASKLVTLQVGGSERFSVDKAGNVLIGNGGDLQISSATGGNNSTLYNDAQDLYITTNGSTRMYINSSGNVGIGNVSPGTRLDVTGNIRLSAAAPVIEWNSGGAQVYAPAANTLAIATGGGIGSPVERMRINSSGNVGIGTSSPAQRLHVATTAAPSGTTQSFLRATADVGFGADFGGGIIQGVGPIATISTVSSGTATERMRIDGSGNVGIGLTGPQLPLSIGKGGGAPPATSGSTQSSGGIARLGSSGAATLDVGTLSSGSAWLQATNVTNLASNFDMLLNPNGGNVGIGTSSPTQRLHVRQDQNGTTAALIQNRNGTGSPVAAVQFISGGFDLSDNRYAMIASDGGSNTTLQFWTGQGATPTEKMRVNSSGNLLVGTSSTFDNVSFLTAQFQGGVSTKIAGTGATSQMSFFNNNGRVGYIGTDGTTTTYYTSSDARLKHDIVNAPDAADLIDAIKVRSFKWNADNSEQRYGFVAQELLEVAPEAVGGTPDGDEMMGVDYSKLVPMLIKEVQSLRARVAQLETSAATITFEGN